MAEKQKIVVFEENGSGDYKIAGIEVYGKGLEITKVVNIEGSLPPIIDEPEEYITDDFYGDLVLNFLKHPDLSEYLVKLCNQKNIPCIASGQRIQGAICPFTCCGLAFDTKLGPYGEQFGLPRFEVTLEKGHISSLQVKRAASCGATFQVAKDILGTDIEEAPVLISRLVQYICYVDPSDFDPVTGKSRLHFAGEVHKGGLERAIKRALERGENGTGKS